MILYTVRLIGVVLWFLVSCIPALIRALVHPFDPKNGALFCSLWNPLGLKLTGLDVDYRQLETYEKAPKAIFMANHQSNLDLLIFGKHQMTGKNVTIGKSSIKWIPLFGQVFWLSSHLLINRSDKKSSHKKVDDLVEKIILRPYSIWIFPEGTRSRGRGLGEFKKGPFRTAIQTGLPIIPVVASSLHKYVDYTRWHAGKVIVDVLDPIETQGYKIGDLDQLREEVRQKMQRRIEQLDAELANKSLPLPRSPLVETSKELPRE